MTVALDAASFRAAMSQFASGVAVVTTAGPAGMTASAICSLSLEPVLLVVCLDRGSRTLAAARRSGRLAVNVLAAGQLELAIAFATKRAEPEKWAGVAFREEAGLPVLDGTVAWLVGAVREWVPGGDHEIAIVEAERAEAPGGEPLIHHRSAYRALESGDG